MAVNRFKILLPPKPIATFKSQKRVNAINSGSLRPKNWNDPPISKKFGQNFPRIINKASDPVNVCRPNQAIAATQPLKNPGSFAPRLP